MSEEKPARKAGGPKTAAGKARAAQNSLRHGILASAALISTGAGQEDGGVFNSLLEGLIGDLQPVGALERVVVEQLAVLAWRLGRLYRAEAGAIASQQNAAIAQKQKAESSRLARQLRVVDVVKESISLDKGLSEPVQSLLAESFGASSRFVATCLTLSKQRKHLTYVIDREQEALMAAKETAEALEQSQAQARLAALSLPSGDQADLLLRYEGSLGRQLRHAIHTLHDLQDRRKRLQGGGS